MFQTSESVQNSRCTRRPVRKLFPSGCLVSRILSGSIYHWYATRVNLTTRVPHISVLKYVAASFRCSLNMPKFIVLFFLWCSVMTFWVAANTISVEVVETAPFKAGFDNMSITEGVPIADLHALFSTQYILISYMISYTTPSTIVIGPEQV